jgi:hypothetical protein
MFNVLESWLSSLTPTTGLQLYTAVISTLVFVISFCTFLYNVNKDRTEIKIEIKRDNYSLLALNKPLNNYLLIEVVNKSSKPVIINEVGVTNRGKDFNFVNLINIFLTLKENKKEVMAGIEVESIPGIVSPQSMGVALISFSDFEKTYEQIKEEKELLPEEAGYLKTRDFINTYIELMQSYDASTQVLTVTPYGVTTTGKRFKGKRTKIQLINSHKVV